MRQFPILVSLVASMAAASREPVSNDYSAAKEKIAQIESDRVPSGGRVVLTAAELNAYVQHEVLTVTDGVREPRIELLGGSVARGTALIDFAKVRAAQGHPPGWLLSKILEGERPVAVTARIRSGGGQATVDVERVEISGLAIDGDTLQFLIQHFLLPLYPNAVVGRPFALGHRMERLEVRPASVTVSFGH
ncbi:MAG: hypothetical protein JO336_14655 [Acidobacteriia bacterium]|nr:hypothetical protein [Terriglobia bacterium]